MVPLPLRLPAAARAARAAAAAVSLSLACRGARETDGAATTAGRVVELVRAQYADRDATPAGAWSWEAGNGIVWVLVDVESSVPGVVQARVELWGGDTATVVRFGRSDVMPATAEVGAYAFEDLTGDSVPDLLGYVADSAGVAFPVFVPGARGAMADELEEASRGWRFATDEERMPEPVRGAAGVCALRLWAEATPDGSAPGWRYLALRGDGSLAPPAADAPPCRPGPRDTAAAPG